MHFYNIDKYIIPRLTLQLGVPADTDTNPILFFSPSGTVGRYRCDSVVVLSDQTGYSWFISLFILSLCSRILLIFLT